MSVLFDGSLVMLFASVAGLIMCFRRVPAIPVAWVISEKDEKHTRANGLAFPRGGGKMSA